MSSPPNREVALFGDALELPPGQRAAFLQKACADDPPLRLRLEALFRVHEEALTFLETPAGAEGKSQLGAEIPDLTVRPANNPAEKALKRIGRYKLLQQIGEGGCGVVYMAEQEEPVRRRVALKVIKLGMDTKHVIARFEAERQALALMDHPNIAKVLEAGATDSGRPYFVMELVRGTRITQYCDENHLPTADRLELFMKVSQAVQHAHQKGIIHRDLKPSNILVADHDGVPVPKIIDFGIAKATTDQRLTDKTLFTAFEQFMGTPAYMSPEQAKLSGLDIDTRTDIYSLGVLLYELLTGKTPFDSQTLLAAGLDEMCRTIREQEPAPPSTRLSTLLASELMTAARHRQTDVTKLIHNVRGDLDWIVMKSLEKDRTRRYETATGLAMDIQRHLKNEPVLARPPSNLYRFQKMAQRNRLFFGAATAVLAALVIGLGVSTWLFFAERGARQRAVAAEHEQEQFRRQAEAAGTKLGQSLTRETLQRQRAEEVVVRLELQRAEDWLAADNEVQGLTALARLLRGQPTNLIVAHRLVSALTHRSFCLPVFEPLRHEKSVQSAEFGPNGERIVTASLDGTAQVWDAETGRTLTPPLRHSAGVNSARFSPDGEKVVTCSDDMTARIWDGRSGRPLSPPLLHLARVRSAVFSPDNERVVTASDDGTARIWYARTGKPAFEPLKHDGAVNSAQFSADGVWVLTASQDGTARMWDTRTGLSAAHLFRHGGPVNAAQFSPDGQCVATASEDHTGRVWDAQTGEPLSPPLLHEHDVYFIQFSPDGKRVATASLDRTARLWDARTGRLLGKPLAHDAQVSMVQFSHDGLRVVTASEDGVARVWHALTGEPLTERMSHENKLFSAVFSPNGQRVLTASEDKTARVWDVRPGGAFVRALNHASFAREGRPPPEGRRFSNADWSGERPAFAQFSRDGGRIVTVCGDQSARIWDAVTGQELTPPLRHEEWVTSAEFSLDGHAVITASAGGLARVWDARTGQPLTNPMRHQARVTSAQFSADGLRVVTASWDKTARVWDARTGRPLTDPLVHGDAVSSARFSPDGNRIVTAAGDDTVRMWEARTGQPFGKPMRHGGWVGYAEFSPDGLRVLSASSDNTARVWDARTGEPISPPLQHQGGVSFAQFSPDGLRVATCSWDRTARLWDSQTGKALTEPLRHGAAVHTVYFSNGGDWLVTASEDGTVRIWDSRTGQPASDALRSGGEPVSSARFSPDGRQLVSVPLNGTVRIWEAPQFTLPIPPWLAALAEAVVGHRLTEGGSLEVVPARAYLEMKRQLETESSGDACHRWALWFIADRSARTISP